MVVFTDCNGKPIYKGNLVKASRNINYEINSPNEMVVKGTTGIVFGASPLGFFVYVSFEYGVNGTVELNCFSREIEAI